MSSEHLNSLDASATAMVDSPDPDLASPLEIKDVAQRAQAALGRSPIFALRELRVSAEGEQLVIAGRLASFYHSQLAQEAVRLVADGLHVVNHVHVEDEL